MSKKLTTEEFKEKFHKKYGDLYNLDKVIYENNKKEVIVTCSLHGDFPKRPDLLLSGGKCPECSKTKGLTEAKFIERATKVHNGFFTYKNCNFTKVDEEVTVTCPIHGTWKPKANNHLRGYNCPECYKEGITHPITKLWEDNGKTKKYDTKSFVEKARKVHGNKYDYSKTEYMGNDQTVTVTCPIHGDFPITPNHLLGGRGCQKCAGNARLDTQEFIIKAYNKHGDKYDYSKVKYVRTHDNIAVICKEHGEFPISPANHLRGKGCPLCKQSNLEKEIKKLLEDNAIEFIANKKHKWLQVNENKRSCLTLDFYLPQYKIAIECQGIQHFKSVPYFGGEEGFKDAKERDTLKKQLCENNGVKMLYFSNLGIDYPYEVFEDKEKLLEEIKK